jgi:UDP-N-acetyl-D-mannosaminuronate dehydrogenase
MAARKTVKQVDAEQNTDEARIAELEKKVQVLWDMVVFLADHPHYRVGDYLNERGLV